MYISTIVGINDTLSVGLDMHLIDRKIPLSTLRELHCSVFGTMTKAVVDIAKKVFVADAELHADQESFLLETGSRQQDLWGINLYPGKSREEFIEYTSLINIRPTQDNVSMEVLAEEVREAIRMVVFSLVDFDA